LAAKEQRASSTPHMENDELEIAGIGPGPHAVPAPWHEAQPTD